MACSDETSFSINPTPELVEIYRRARLRLEGLESWLEVGDRPPISSHGGDIDLYESEVDDIKSLRLRYVILHEKLHGLQCRRHRKIATSLWLLQGFVGQD